MKGENYCQTCSKYYRFDDDLGDMLCEGCNLDLPIFSSKTPIVCNSYSRRGYDGH